MSNRLEDPNIPFGFYCYEFGESLMATPKSQTTPPWWIEYRQQRRLQLHQTLTVEMIFRRSFLQMLREYVKCSSISGMEKLFDPKVGWLHRAVHTLIFVFLVTLLVYLFRLTWLGTFSSPLVVSTESNTYPIGEIDFPAVAICNVNRISKRALKNIAIRLYPKLAVNNESLEEVEQFLLQAGRLLDFSYDERIGKGNSFLDLTVEIKHNSSFVVEFMKMMAPSCSDMLVRCVWAGEIVPCEDIFSTRRTGRGHCCAFNYVLDYDSAKSPMNTIAEPKRQSLPGFYHGLVVILEPMVDDYAYPVNNFVGFDVLLYDPSHFADLTAGRIIHRMVEPDKAEFMVIKSIKQVASAEVRKYPLKSRKCLFKDESSVMYSYSACIVQCRIRAVQSLCKCTPYFLPTSKEDAVCTMDDLKCLNKYKEKLMYLYPITAEKFEGLEVEQEDSLYCPDCHPDCELTQHFTKSYRAPIHTLESREFYKDEFLEGVNMTGKSCLSVYHAVADGSLDRLDAVAYWYEVLSNIGGYAGVILGLSVFSVVEIVYFLLVRLVFLIRYNYRKYG